MHHRQLDDATGTVLLDTLVKPSGLIPSSATAVSGIVAQDVAVAPGWPAVGLQVAELLAGRLVTAHNAAFDDDTLTHERLRHSLAVSSYRTRCTMALLTPPNGGSWPSLDAAARLAGVQPSSGCRHRARGDAELCRSIVSALAGRA